MSGYLLSGEFHYFRTRRASWGPALRLAREAGLGTVSIYVPWNWHQPAPGPADFKGAISPEHSLLAALDVIADAGLRCILRPGPFITAEWRNGGIPDWLLQAHPGMRALDHRGLAAGHAYPAITYAHPRYREACRDWLTAVGEAVAGHLEGAGGPIVSVQLDDEPSYWQQLHHPLAVDYNPLLVSAAGGQPSAYGSWLLSRYGSLDGAAAAHREAYPSASAIQPPRREPSDLAHLRRYLDWLDFKLDQINDYVAFLVAVAKEAGLGTRMSMLHPYLLPLNAVKFAAFAAEHELGLQLTNECYLSLFSTASAAEQKVGSILACHETYHLWRNPGDGLPVTMELQGSNATYLPAGAMELLYALTVARGIQGINYFMLVGGQNPPGFENLTGSEYDISAPISASAQTRPHYQVIKKLSQVVHAAEPEILAAEPVRDIWLGCYVPYESAALSATAGILDLATITETFSNGDIGQSEASSLAALLGLASISFGCIDLERAGAEALASARQLWVPGLAFMSDSAQQALADYVSSGGHLVMLPDLPFTDDCGNPVTVLRDLIWGDAARPAASLLAPGQEPGYAQQRHTLIRSESGDTIVAPGTVASYPALPAGATVLARVAGTGEPCAFSCARGRGQVTHLGFRLQYMPTTGDGQFRFARQLAESAVAVSVTSSNRQLAAFSLGGPAGGLLCVANPAEVPARGRIDVGGPAHPGSRRVPAVLESLEFAGRGARLLPFDLRLGGDLRLRHATWELIGREETAGVVRLRFAAATPEGELAFDGLPAEVSIEGGALIARRGLPEGADVLLLRAVSAEPVVELRRAEPGNGEVAR